MLGPILASIGTFFEEIAGSIGKKEVALNQENAYSLAFINLFWAAILFIIIGLVSSRGFVFDLRSLPILALRCSLEIFILYFSIFGIIKADRTTFNFVRTLTIPLLLIVDLLIGYQIDKPAIIGIIIIMTTLLVSFASKQIAKKGIGLVMASSIGAVITISLYKYNITHYNSVAAEQLIAVSFLLIFTFVLALIKNRQNPLKLLIKPIFFGQSFSMGIGSAIESFAFSYGAASLVLTAKRSSSIFWSLLSGKLYFAEKHLIFKIAIFSLLLLGLILLVL